MFIAVYASSGGGILLLLVLLAIGVALLAWIIYWASRGFRAAPPRSRRGLAWWLLLLVPLLTLLICFPPMRRAGQWSDAVTGNPAAATAATEFDRKLFGYIPSYRWVGQLGSQAQSGPGSLVVDKHRRYYSSDQERWVIDWLYVGGEGVVLTILLLPFALARRGEAVPNP